jgi:hypothetical protein
VGQRRAKSAAHAAGAHDQPGHLLAADSTPQVTPALRERAFQKPLHPDSSDTAYPHEKPRPGFRSTSHATIASARTRSPSGPLAPLDGVFRPFMATSRRELTSFQAKRERLRQRSGGLEAARLEGEGRSATSRHGGSPPRSRNKDFLRKRPAWRIQELAEGGLSERALARIEELGPVALASWRRRARAGMPASSRVPLEMVARDPRLPAIGTALTRIHGTTEHTVTILDDGFEYRGERYRSLSKIARVITGTPWNG